MKAFVLLVAATAAIRLSDPLTRAEEARAVEKATTNRILDGLGERNSASRNGWVGKWNYAYEDFEKKMGPVDQLPVLNRAVGRINHPNYPYPMP